MDWYSVGLSAVAGSLAAVAAALIVPRHGERRVRYVVVFVSLFAVLTAVGRYAVIPAIKLPIEMRKAERQLLELPAYAALNEHDPQAMASIMAVIEDGLRNGSNTAELIARVKPIMARVVRSRLPASSDEAIVAYLAVTIRQMRELRAKDPRLCSAFLFPQGNVALNISEHISPDLVAAEMAALTEVIRTSAVAPQRRPAVADVEGDLGISFAALSSKHGDTARMLENFSAPGVDPAIACDVATDLYSEVLSLPPQRAGPVLRFMLSP